MAFGGSLIANLFVCCGIFNVFITALSIIFARTVVLLGSIITGVSRCWTACAACCGLCSDNPKYTAVVALTALIVVGIGLPGAFYTDDLLSSLDFLWECGVRRMAEIVNKYFLILLRDFNRLWGALWNIYLRYFYSECMTLLVENMYQYGISLADLWNEGKITCGTACDTLNPTSFFTYVTLGGSVLGHAVFQLPYLLYVPLIECPAYGWTRPHPLYIVPVETFEAGGFTIPAYYMTTQAVSLDAFEQAKLLDSLWPNATFSTPPDYATMNVTQSNSFNYTIGQRAFEFNPRWGAYNRFYDNDFLRYVRRVAVGLQTTVLDIYRTIFIILRLFREGIGTEFWEAAVVEVNSSLSLWRMISDTLARFYFFRFTVIMPPWEHCDNIPVPETSRMRYITEFLVFKLFRSVANIVRALALIVYEALTTKSNGVPVIDIVYDIFTFVAGSNPNLFRGFNLLKREWVFCHAYEASGAQAAASLALRTAWEDCVIWPRFYVGFCPLWDGKSFQTLTDDVKIPHLQYVVNAIIDLIYYFTAFERVTQIVKCDPTYRWDAGFTSRLDRLRNLVLLLSDVLMSTIFIIVSRAACVQLYVVAEISVFLKLVRWIVLDELLNRGIPLLISVITDLDCVKGQNFFTCIITQLAVTDPLGALRLFCDTAKLALNIFELLSTTVKYVFGNVVKPVVDYIFKDVVPWINQWIIAKVNGIISTLTAGIAHTSDLIPYIRVPSALNVPSVSDIHFGNVLMPCTYSQLQTALAQYGPITKKRTVSQEGEEDWVLEWPDEISDDFYEKIWMTTADEAAKQDHESFASFNKRADAQHFIHKLENEKDEEVRKAIIFEEVKARAEELAQSRSEDIATFQYAQLASDAYTLYGAFEKCYLGAFDSEYTRTENEYGEEVDDVTYYLREPSQYQLCVKMSTDVFESSFFAQQQPQLQMAKEYENLFIDEADANTACIATRCMQVAHDCFAEELRKNARRLGNEERRNMWYDNYIVDTAHWFVRQGTWLAETGSCTFAHDYLRRTSSYTEKSLRFVAGVISFVYDSGARAKYISTNYGTAYYDCLQASKLSLNENTTPPSSGELAVEYIHCLERRYVNETQLYRAPPNVHSMTDKQVLRTYLLDEQQQMNDTWCFKLLTDYGLILEDTISANLAMLANVTVDEIAYRMCAYTHAFGTRATLATHAASVHGRDKFVLDDAKIESRTPSMWRPLLGKRDLDDYMTWKAPFAAMRSAEFLGTQMFDLVGKVLRTLSDASIRAYKYLSQWNVEMYLKMGARLVSGSRPTWLALQRVAAYWSSLYDTLIDPRFDSDAPGALRARNRFMSMSKERKDAEALRMHAEMLDDLEKIYVDAGAHYDDERKTVVSAAWGAVHGKHKRADDMLRTDEGNNRKRGIRIVRPAFSDKAAARAQAEYHETYVGRDADGYDMYEIDLDARDSHTQHRKTHMTDREAVIDAYARHASSQLYWAVHADYSPEQHALQRRAQLPRGGNQTVEVRLDDGRHAPAHFVPIEYIESRGERTPSRVMVSARVDNTLDLITNKPNLAAGWKHSPYMHIDLASLSQALRLFMNKTLDLNEARTAQERSSMGDDLRDAQRALHAIDQVRFPASKRRSWQHIRLFANLTNADDVRRMVLSSTDEERAKLSSDELYNALIANEKYGKSNPNAVGSAVSAISHIINRRLRYYDLPPVQAMAMLLDALATDDIESLAAWMSGELGYVTGVGFVPRIMYETYMQAVNERREKLIIPYTHGIGYMERRRPALLLAYDKYLQLEGERESVRKERRRAREKVDLERRHEANVMYNMLRRDGFFEDFIHHGGERAWEELNAIAPHMIDKWTRSDGVDIAHVEHVMRNTKFEHRTAHEHRALRIVSRTPTDVASAVGETFIGTLQTIWEFVLGKIGVPVANFFINLWATLDKWAMNFPSAVENFFISSWPPDLSGFLCDAPNDYILDGTGTYGPGCLLQLYWPERLFEFITWWPRNNHTGEICWPADAYVSGTCDCPDGPWFPDSICTPELIFVDANDPLAFGPDRFDDDDFDDDDNALDDVADNDDSQDDAFDDDDDTPGDDDDVAYAQNPDFNGALLSFTSDLHVFNTSRWCLVQGFQNHTKICNQYADSMMNASHPKCPQCSQCIREYNSCVDAGKGFDPLVVIQTAYALIRDLWAEIWDVTNSPYVFVSVILLQLWIGLMNTWLFTPFRYVCCVNIVFIIIDYSVRVILGTLALYGLLFDDFAGAIAPLAFLLFLTMLPYGGVLGYIFWTVLSFRYIYYNFSGFFEDIAGNPINPDPLDFDLPPIFSWIADAIGWIGDLPCVIPFLCHCPVAPATCTYWLGSVSENLVFLQALEDDLRIYESSSPTSFDVVCSIFGLWSVVVAILLFLPIGLVCITLGGVAAAAISLAIGVVAALLAIAQYGWAILITILLLLALFCRDPFNSDEATNERMQRIKRRVDELAKERRKKEFDKLPFRKKGTSGALEDADDEDDDELQQQSHASNIFTNLRRRTTTTNKDVTV